MEAIAKDMALTVKNSVKSSMESLRKDFQKEIDLISSKIESIPDPNKGKDGKDGVDGKDGKDGQDGQSTLPEDVAKSMEGYFAKWVLDFERKADLVLEKAVDKLKQPENGLDGKDGRDAIELEDFNIELSDDLRTIKMSLIKGDSVIEKTLKIPCLLDKGVYKSENTYEKGDGVTYGGSFWICQKDGADGKPSSSDDWRLAVKKGRDGRETVKIERKIDKVKI
jgi:hypothetical protein